MLRDLGNGETESVAAYDSYNHHYGVQLLSSAVRLSYDAAGAAPDGKGAAVPSFRRRGGGGGGATRLFFVRHNRKWKLVRGGF